MAENYLGRIVSIQYVVVSYRRKESEVLLAFLDYGNGFPSEVAQPHLHYLLGNFEVYGYYLDSLKPTELLYRRLTDVIGNYYRVFLFVKILSNSVEVLPVFYIFREVSIAEFLEELRLC